MKQYVTEVLVDAVAAPFAALAAERQARVSKLERDNELLRTGNDDLEENREYLSLLVMMKPGQTDEETERVRETLANILRGRKGYER